MVDIPPEIWFHIAKFIPEHELRDLLTVNSLFFNLAMDIRYRELVLSTRTTDQRIKTLKGLCDPLLASRVQRLSLRLPYVKKGVNINASTLGSNNIRHQLKHTITHIFGGSKSPRPRPIDVTLTDLINEIINIADNLVNVSKLYIDLCDLPPLYDFQPLFSSFWSAFGPKIHTLSFCGILKDFCSLINSNPPLNGLQVLCIEVAPSFDGMDAAQAILLDTLLPFINSQAPHLTSLKLWSWSSVDLSAFFSQLAPFPGLKTLSVRTDFNQAFSDPSGLNKLICDGCGTLRRVDLRLNPAGAGSINNPLVEESLGRWLLGCISDERFLSQVQVLDIYPTTLTTGMETLLRYIQRTRKNLVELIVRDRYLQEREAFTVIDGVAGCRKLTSLKINIRTLNVALIDHLARRLPKIDRLWLSVGDNAVDDFSYLDVFIKDLGTRVYHNWKLEDITIRQNGQEADSDVMLAIGRSIPSVTSFFSSGHMQLSKSSSIRQTARYL